MHAAQGSGSPARPASPALRRTLIGVTVGFLGVVLFLPLLVVMVEAFGKGPGEYFSKLFDGELMHAARLTLLIMAIAVPLNLVFGVAAAWLITKHDFVGKGLLVSLVDLPFSVSPVISGLIYVLLFGRQGVLGPWLADHDIQIIFAVPGLVLATVFVTFPFVARELIPLMEAQGREEELAAAVLGASTWQTFVRVTLPNIKWGLLYGAILCSARAMGEFGAVSVVSGHVRGETNTIPLHVEVLYNEYDFVGAFAAASILMSLGLVTLGLKTWAERKAAQDMAEASKAVAEVRGE